MPTTLFRLSDFIPLHRAKSDSDKVVSNKAVIFYINHLGQDVRGVGDVVKLAADKLDTKIEKAKKVFTIGLDFLIFEK